MAAIKKQPKKQYPGSIFKLKDRWYWKVKFPGESRRQTVSLVPEGGTVATRDHGVAIEIAKRLWQEKTAQKRPEDVRPDTLTVEVFTAMFQGHVDRTFTKPDGNIAPECYRTRYAIRAVNAVCGSMLIYDFDARCVEQIKDYMADSLDLSMKTVNDRLNVVKRMIKWGMKNKLCTPNQWYEITAVEGVRRNRPGIKPPRIVKAINYDTHVKPLEPFCTPTLWAMMNVQYLTGMRSGELCTMKPTNLKNRTETVWKYVPDEHKTSYLGRVRAIPVMPKAQTFLSPLLVDRPENEYIFKPEESEQYRKENQRKGGRIEYNDCYLNKTYRDAIQYAIRRANKNRKPKIPAWTPHQLRHTAATNIAALHGIETAKAVLGHSKINTTEIYAEHDWQLAEQWAKNS